VKLHNVRKKLVEMHDTTLASKIVQDHASDDLLSFGGVWSEWLMDCGQSICLPLCGITANLK